MIKVFILALIFNVYRFHTCSTFIIGKNATLDGSVIISHSDDGTGKSDPRIVKIEGQKYEKGAKRPIMPYENDGNYPREISYRAPAFYPKDGQKETISAGYIDQVEETYTYFDGGPGIMNEWGVGIAESSCSAIFNAIRMGAPGGTALFSIDELSKIALERTKTAADAVDLIGSLAEEYGFYGAQEIKFNPATNTMESTNFIGGEALIIADNEEAWVLHILADDTGTSAIWVAQRVKDDHVAGVYNMYTIRALDFNSPKTFKIGNLVKTVAIRNGLWSEKDEEIFDFTKIYSKGEYTHKYYSGRRQWRAFSLANPDLNLDPEYQDLRNEIVYPFSVKPNRKLSAHDVFEFHRDYYQGTKFDTSKKPAGGPFENPIRYTVTNDQQKEINGEFERTISIYRTTFSWLVSLKSSLRNSRENIAFLALHEPLSAVFIPIYTNLDLPKSFSDVSMFELNKNTFYWANRFVRNIMHLRFDRMYPIMRERQIFWENEISNFISKSILMENEDFVFKNEYLKIVNKVLEDWVKLSDDLMLHFTDNCDEKGDDLGYPAWWLVQVGYLHGPPPAVDDFISPIAMENNHFWNSIFLICITMMGLMLFSYMWYLHISPGSRAGYTLIN